MRLSSLGRYVAVPVGVFAALGLIGSFGMPQAGASTGPGAQVAATQWTPTNPPSINSEAYDDSVSCVSSSFCMANTLQEDANSTASVQIWNGSTWTTSTIEAPSGSVGITQTSVSCTSVSFCVVVGAAVFESTTRYYSPFVDQWNGSSWSGGTTVSTPDGYDNAELASVSCTGPAWCMAVGVAAGNEPNDAITSFAVQWNGATWSTSPTATVPGATDDVLAGVSCTGPTNCMAVGESAAESTASILPTSGSSPLGLGGRAAPFGITVPGLQAHAEPNTPPQVTDVLAEQWNGSSWSVSPTVTPTGVTNPGFGGVSCAGSGFCMATGGFSIVDGSSSSFAEEWSGGTWSQAPLPTSPAGGPVEIGGISCISSTSCTAVGLSALSTDSDSGSDYLSASWNGSTWAFTTVPAPSATDTGIWVGISCLSGGYCVAAGGIETASEVISPSNAQAPIGRTGYRFVASDGGVFSYGPPAPGLGAPFVGSMGGAHLNQPIVGMTTVPSGDGYDLVAADGGVFNFGSAAFYGSAGGTHLNKPIVGMAITADGGGYWLVASDGGVFSYGDAQFYGSAGGIHLNQPIVGMASTPNGLGYYLVAADGGIFTYGNATFAGSTGGAHLNKPIVGMAVTAAGGYYLVGADGGVFNYGGAPLFGSTGGTKLNKPIVGIGTALGGYYLVASDGGVFDFGGTNPPQFFGSAGAIHLNQPIVGIAV